MTNQPGSDICAWQLSGILSLFTKLDLCWGGGCGLGLILDVVSAPSSTTKEA